MLIVVVVVSVVVVSVVVVIVRDLVSSDNNPFRRARLTDSTQSTQMKFEFGFFSFLFSNQNPSKLQYIIASIIMMCRRSSIMIWTSQTISFFLTIQ